MRYFLFLVVILFSVGCSPKYIVKNQYIPPKEESLLVCVDNCASAKKICLENCDTSYKICEQDAYNRAKDISNIENIQYDKEYTNYQNSLNLYRTDMRIWQRNFDNRSSDYRYFLDRCRHAHDVFACKRQDALHVELQQMKIRKPMKPIEPVKPIFSSIYNNELKRCSKTCNCEANYDSCFISCGGEIVPYRMCIANCD
jgi:hypothetical protein